MHGPQNGRHTTLVKCSCITITFQRVLVRYDAARSSFALHHLHALVPIYRPIVVKFNNCARCCLMKTTQHDKFCTILCTQQSPECLHCTQNIPHLHQARICYLQMMLARWRNVNSVPQLLLLCCFAYFAVSQSLQCGGTTIDNCK